MASFFTRRFGRLALPPLFLLLALVAAGCGSPAREETGLSGTIAIDGSSTVFPITEAVAEAFQGRHPLVRIPVGVSGTGGGFTKFCSGETAINNASRPIRPVEMEMCRENGVEYLELAVAYDGLSVVVHPDNGWVDSLTVEELKKIWEPAAQGKVTYWDQVRPGWPHEEIHLYGPGTDSGTYDYFTEVIVGEAGASRGDYVASEDDNVLIQGVSGDSLALGFFGYAYYAENRDRLKAVPVVHPATGTPVAPTAESINTGAYFPLSRPLYIYVSEKAAERPEVEAFVEFYLEEARELTSQVGFVPLPEASYAEALERFRSR